MTHEESLKWQTKEKAFLDTLDLKPYLKPHTDIATIMDKIQDIFGHKYKEEKFVFNCMDQFEFMDYLRQKYDISFYEYCEYRIALI